MSGARRNKWQGTRPHDSSQMITSRAVGWTGHQAEETGQA